MGKDKKDLDIKPPSIDTVIETSKAYIHIIGDAVGDKNYAGALFLADNMANVFPYARDFKTDALYAFIAAGLQEYMNQSKEKIGPEATKTYDKIINKITEKSEYLRE